MKIIALDQSIKKTGFILYDKKQNKIIEAKTIIPENDYWLAKVEFLIEYLDKLLSKNKDIEIVLIEDVFLRKNIQTLKKLAFLQGAIAGLCYKFKISYMFLLQNEARKKVLNSKELTQENKEKLLSYFFKDKTNIDEHIIDALILLLAYLKLKDNI